MEEGYMILPTGSLCNGVVCTHEPHLPAVFLARSSPPEATVGTDPRDLRKSGVKKIRLALPLDLIFYREADSARPVQYPALAPEPR